MKKWLFISFGVLAIGAAIASGYMWYQQTQEPQAAGGTGGPIALSQAETAENAAKQDDVLQVRNSDAGSMQGTNIAENSGSARNNSAPRATPDPNDFSQYEKYKNETISLYQDVRLGSGEEAKYGMTLTMNYRGWLTDGRIFDESYARKQPFSFVLGAGQVIAGWEQSVAGMKVGGKRRLIVPPAVGYGDKPQGPIPANSLLVFDVELMEVKQ